MPFIKITILTLVLSLIGCTSNNTIPSYKNNKNPFFGGSYKIGDPYLVDGKVYYPSENNDYDEVGVASWYGKKFHKRLTANGETFDMFKISAAHKTLPLPSIVKVINLENNKSIILRVNDRGPFAKDRIIDLSMRAAERLGFKEQGTSKVRVQYHSSAKVYDSLGRIIPKNKYLDNSEINTYKKKKNSKNTYNLTIGSFKDKENVERIKKMLKGFTKLKIEKKEKDGVSLFKVLIGPYYRKDYLIKLQETVNIIGITGTKIILNEEK